MSEETQSVASETVSEQPTQETPTQSTDVGALIAESKKYRKRSQDAEAELAKIRESLKKTEENKLKQKEEYKTLYEEVSSENESLKSTAEKWTKYEQAKRTSLLEQHPEGERDSLVDLPLDALELVTNKINSAKANAPEVIGNPRGFKEVAKDWTSMNRDELRENWDDILKSAKARMKK